MNSKNLSEEGFGDWLSLKTLAPSSLPQDQGIVIAIVNKELSDKPESDILYIGRTKRPAKRLLGGYLAGYGGKNTRRINQLLLKEGYINKVAISWAPADKPRVKQEELLAKFKKDTGSLPAWNTKKPQVKPKKAAKTKAPTTPTFKARVTLPTAPKKQEPNTSKAAKPMVANPKAALITPEKEETSP